ncbi:Hypp5587 [Branchiostoma lanceolatum]|uniref:Hypp5587 protein n=1 Tax=Branchiostoma lanceolatum TaxID=7740 RepID=A0A8J9YS44_BRALA|nr:Hypp5587 [Branchiostoma lanceolatum]
MSDSLSFNQSFDNLFVDDNSTWVNETVVSEEEESTVDWVFIRTLVVVLALSVTVLLGTVTLVYNFVCFERAPQQRRR